MKNFELELLLNQELKVLNFEDHAPNGLQVEGRYEVKKIVTGVTACQALLDKAVELKADAILVHHGYFWKNDPAVVKGMLRKRLKTLLAHDINLYAYHLPLDAHPILGNNAQLAKLIGMDVTGTLSPWVFKGKLPLAMTAKALQQHLEVCLGRSVLHCGEDPLDKISHLGWCTGGGQKYIELAADAMLDAFITGEVSEQTIHTVRERGIHFFSAGHHATERYGIKALGKWLHVEHGFEVSFIDIPNPA